VHVAQVVGPVEVGRVEAEDVDVLVVELRQRKRQDWCKLAAALEYIHSERFTRRDIKPDNVMVDPSGRITLLDFGIARPLERFQVMTQKHTGAGSRGASGCSDGRLRCRWCSRSWSGSRRAGDP